MTSSLHEKIPKNNLKIFEEKSRYQTSKVRQQLSTLRNDCNIFSQMLISCQTRQGDLDKFFSHENMEYPPSLSKNGDFNTGSESDLIPCLENLIPSENVKSQPSCIILDGPVIVQMLKPGSVKTFNSYAEDVFLPYISNLSKEYKRVDIVWDRYTKNSLKHKIRENRGVGKRKRVSGSAILPTNWQSFLRCDQNKEEFFKFLSIKVLEEFEHNKTCEVIVTIDNNVKSTDLVMDTSDLGPDCTHEEADTRIFLHTLHASNQGHSQISIRSVDTDVVVLAIAAFNKIPNLKELFIAFGTGKKFWYIPIHQITEILGPEKASSLHTMHALTGCDTTSFFRGHGKKSCWSVWFTYPELTEALSNITKSSETISEQDLHIIERYVILFL